MPQYASSSRSELQKTKKEIGSDGKLVEQEPAKYSTRELVDKIFSVQELSDKHRGHPPRHLFLRLFFHLLTWGSSLAMDPTPSPETVLLSQFTQPPMANDSSPARTRRTALIMTTVRVIILTPMLPGAGTVIIKPGTSGGLFI